MDMDYRESYLSLYLLQMINYIEIKIKIAP